MALPSPITPGTDDFATWVAAFNALLTQVPDGMAWDGALLTSLNGASPLFSVGLPPPPDRVVSGLGLSITGSYNITWTAGEVVIDAVLTSILGGSISLTPADPTDARWDVLSIDGVVTLTEGTPTSQPQAPAFTGLPLGFIYVAPLVAPIVFAKSCCPTGTYIGQKLIWDGAQFSPAFNNGLLKISTTPVTITPIADRIIFLAGAAGGTFTLDAATLTDGLQYQFTNATNNFINLNGDGKDFEENGTSLYTIVDGESRTFMYSADADMWFTISA